jgi:hypothetical protein
MHKHNNKHYAERQYMPYPKHLYKYFFSTLFLISSLFFPLYKYHNNQINIDVIQQKKDIQFMYNIIVENHPGIYNTYEVL